MSWNCSLDPFELCSGQVHPNALDLAIQLEHLPAVLTTPTGLLEAAEGCCGIDEVVAVDPYRASFECSGGAVRLLEIIRPDSGRKAVFAVIRLRNEIIDILPGDGRQHGAEDLFAHDAHLGVRTGEHRRL